MKPQRLLAVFLGAYLGSVSLGQRPNSPRSKEEPQQEDVVRINTNLVQVDAVVTDKSGKPVTDLKPEEVQIYEDNRAQKITHFSYIAAEANDGPLSSKPIVGDNSVVPPVRLRPEDVRRTIALVVDDLGLSFQSIYYVRRALKQFVDQQMRAGDLIAIIRTSGGIGALQQFTSDKRQLYAAIDHVKWYAAGRSGVGAFAPIKPPTPGKFGAEIDEKDKELDEFRDDLFSVGTLGAISYVVRGLADLPGRKSILLISDGFKITNYDLPNQVMGLEKTSRNDRTFQKLQKLIDEASRASVVVNTMNATGLQTLSSLSAEDSMADGNNTSGARTPDDDAGLLSDRGNTALDLQSGLDYLSEETGGTAIHNTNDLAGGIKKIMNDKGYYLIGYRPDEATFDPGTGRRTFHHLTLKVMRPGKFDVRMRKGFFGISDNESARGPADAREQILHALISPFGSAGVSIHLTSLFANDARMGSYMRSLLHVDGSALSFTDEADDWHQAQFDVVAVTFGDNGNIVDEVTRVDRLRVRGDAYQRVLKAGFVYMITVPIKKPGPYQLRVVLRDQGSERIGSASQFVEVPDMKKDRLELSGLLVNATQPALNKQRTQSANSVDQLRTNQNDESESLDPASSAAVRRFQPGKVLRYGLMIYNARLDKATGQPQLQIQARLFRSGQPVFTGRVQPFTLNNPPDMKRLSADSSIQLGADMVSGEYVLLVTVTDLLADQKHRTATQWMDFEIQ